MFFKNGLALAKRILFLGMLSLCALWGLASAATATEVTSETELIETVGQAEPTEGNQTQPLEKSDETASVSNSSVEDNKTLTEANKTSCSGCDLPQQDAGEVTRVDKTDEIAETDPVTEKVTGLNREVVTIRFDDDEKLLNTDEGEASSSYSVGQLNGLYEVSLVGNDITHLEVDFPEQPNEQWLLELLDHDGSVVDKTDTTEDLPGVLPARFDTVGVRDFTYIERVRAIHARNGTSIGSISPVAAVLAPCEDLTCETQISVPTNVSDTTKTIELTQPVEDGQGAVVEINLGSEIELEEEFDSGTVAEFVNAQTDYSELLLGNPTTQTLNKASARLSKATREVGGDFDEVKKRLTDYAAFDRVPLKSGPAEFDAVLDNPLANIYELDPEIADDIVFGADNFPVIRTTGVCGLCGMIAYDAAFKGPDGDFYPLVVPDVQFPIDSKNPPRQPFASSGLVESTSAEFLTDIDQGWETLAIYEGVVDPPTPTSGKFAAAVSPVPIASFPDKSYYYALSYDSLGTPSLPQLTTRDSGHQSVGILLEAQGVNSTRYITASTLSDDPLSGFSDAIDTSVPDPVFIDTGTDVDVGIAAGSTRKSVIVPVRLNSPGRQTVFVSVVPEDFDSNGNYIGPKNIPGQTQTNFPNRAIRRAIAADPAVQNSLKDARNKNQLVAKRPNRLTRTSVRSIATRTGTALDATTAVLEGATNVKSFSQNDTYSYQLKFQANGKRKRVMLRTYELRFGDESGDIDVNAFLVGYRKGKPRYAYQTHQPPVRTGATIESSLTLRLNDASDLLSVDKVPKMAVQNYPSIGRISKPEKTPLFA